MNEEYLCNSTLHLYYFDGIGSECTTCKFHYVNWIWAQHMYVSLCQLDLSAPHVCFIMSVGSECTTCMFHYVSLTDCISLSSSAKMAAITVTWKYLHLLFELLHGIHIAKELDKYVLLSINVRRMLTGRQKEKKGHTGFSVIQDEFSHDESQADNDLPEARK